MKWGMLNGVLTLGVGVRRIAWLSRVSGIVPSLNRFAGGQAPLVFGVERWGSPNLLNLMAPFIHSNLGNWNGAGHLVFWSRSAGFAGLRGRCSVSFHSPTSLQDVLEVLSHSA